MVKFILKDIRHDRHFNVGYWARFRLIENHILDENYEDKKFLAHIRN